jgi:hypothetical protein
MPSQAHMPGDSDPTTPHLHYGALVDFTSVTPITSSGIAGPTTSTDYPTTSYHVDSSFR